MKTMLILAGPQGSGNHLFSKIFALHPDVFGWKSLLTTRWQTHRGDEPFRSLWQNNDLIDAFDWNIADYFVTSVSLPFGAVHRNNLFMSDVNEFSAKVEKIGINTKLAIIGRDQNIITLQQQRVRHEVTLPMFIDELDKFKLPIFLSQELLYLYKQHYLRSLNLGIPIAVDDERINDILATDANAKYIVQPELQELDLYIQQMSEIGIG